MTSSPYWDLPIALIGRAGIRSSPNTPETAAQPTSSSRGSGGKSIRVRGPNDVVSGHHGTSRGRTTTSRGIPTDKNVGVGGRAIGYGVRCPKTVFFENRLSGYRFTRGSKVRDHTPAGATGVTE